jgi:hypothetical protein
MPSLFNSVIESGKIIATNQKVIISYFFDLCGRLNDQAVEIIWNFTLIQLKEDEMMLRKKGSQTIGD